MCISCFGHIPRWGWEESESKGATAAAAGCGSGEGVRGGSENQCINYRRRVRGAKMGGPAGRRTALCLWRLRVDGRKKGSKKELRAVVIIRRRDSTLFVGLFVQNETTEERRRRTGRDRSLYSDTFSQLPNECTTLVCPICCCFDTFRSRAVVPLLPSIRPSVRDTVEPHCCTAAPPPE